MSYWDLFNVYLSACHTEVCTGSTEHSTNHFRASSQYLQVNSMVKLITASEAECKVQLARLQEKWEGNGVAQCNSMFKTNNTV